MQHLWVLLSTIAGLDTQVCTTVAHQDNHIQNAHPISPLSAFLQLGFQLRRVGYPQHSYYFGDDDDDIQRVSAGIQSVYQNLSMP